MLDLNSRELRKAAAKLVRDYPDDLEQSAPEEFVQYADMDVWIIQKSVYAEFARLISFPNVNIAFRLYLTLIFLCLTDVQGKGPFRSYPEWKTIFELQWLTNVWVPSR